MSMEPKEYKSTKMLLDAVEESSEQLMSFKTVFPFKLLPDEISIDREQVTLRKRAAPGSEEVTTIKFQDLSNVEHTTGPFYGSIKIYSQVVTEGHYTIEKLRNSDAQKIHALLQGFLIAEDKDIDWSGIPRDELIVLLTELGKPAS